jgi:hypothetical protein
MAYDSTRGCIVLFGGLPVFNPGEGPPLPPDRLLGDTWEHSEPPPTVAVESLVLSPPQVSLSQSPATVITGMITLTGPAPAGGSAVSVNASPPQPPFPTVVVIPGGATTGQFEFTVSSVDPFGVIVTAALGASNKGFGLNVTN